MATTKIVLDDFIKNVRPDPKATDPIIFMSGFLGESPVEGHVRVYADPQLSSFIDVPRTAILYAVQNVRDAENLGGSKLWVKYGDVANASGSFLQGDIYSNYTGGMYEPGTAPQLGRTFLLNDCLRTLPLDPGCRRPSIFGPCVSQFYLCPTKIGVRSLCSPCFTQTASLCHSTICCPRTLPYNCPIKTVAGPCQFETLNCPSIVDGCPTAPTDPWTIYQGGGQGPVVNPTYAGAFNPYKMGY